MLFRSLKKPKPQAALVSGCGFGFPAARFGLRASGPFEKSINVCNESVGGLTGAVVATEAAQIASINANAKKIGSTIVKGFFQYNPFRNYSTNCRTTITS